MEEERIKKILSEVKHPAIDATLAELGIIKEINIEDKKVTVVLAFPFPQIPIENLLVNLVKKPIENSGLIAEIKTTIMDDDAKKKVFIY